MCYDFNVAPLMPLQEIIKFLQNLKKLNVKGNPFDFDQANITKVEFDMALNPYTTSEISV